MTEREFIESCHRFPYSQEYFKLYKEAGEIELLYRYAESFSVNEEEYHAYIESVGEKEEGFFKGLWNRLIDTVIKVGRWIVKKFRQLTRKFYSGSDYNGEKVAEIIKYLNQEKYSDMELMKYLKKPSLKVSIPDKNDEIKKAIDALSEEKRNLLYSMITKRFVFDTKKYNKDHNVKIIDFEHMIEHLDTLIKIIDKLALGKDSEGLSVRKFMKMIRDTVWDSYIRRTMTIDFETLDENILGIETLMQKLISTAKSIKTSTLLGGPGQEEQKSLNDMSEIIKLYADSMEFYQKLSKDLNKMVIIMNKVNKQ